ncbi:aldolase [Limnohabitans sp. JirII-29]|uniref:class II aldolase/adducin family protein n=1 Tax=unclassified Limnohabitans TaxID=2626134 RepID=UPI000C1F7361|nr:MULTISPECIES: class II aldolase/adducin family protein [unclassified Limnohabitans]PIT79731.1 aldolase [Limnohabitans sp. JirII-31]PUE29252.1 aldolase [Limnohabitans sp. JirII-29]
MVSEVLSDLVVANHILVNEGVLDGFGHISVRDPSNPERFYIARSMAPALVTLEDLVSVDLDGVVHDAQGRHTYVERFIHSEIFRARPEVMSVIHSHSPAVIPFGVTGARLRPICHMSGFLGAVTPVYEIRHSAGETSDLLIRNQALGVSLAQCLGQANVALMRGHGSVTVGTSIQQAVYRGIYTESNARLQALAAPLGEINFLTDAEAQATSDMNDQHLDRPWQMWKRKALANPF